jgi:hypothetical protein
MTTTEILATNLAARDEEVLGYQINIDNYRLAIAKIAIEHTGESVLDQAMQEFAKQLEESLQQNIIEQRKAIIIRDVIADQLAES